MAGLLPAFFTLHLGKDVHPGLFPAREGSRESAEDAKSSRSADAQWILLNLTDLGRCTKTTWTTKGELGNFLKPY